MKTILYTGSFDPIHNGHISIARKALLKLKADRLVFVPCWKSSTSKQFSAKFYHRAKMVEIAIQTYDKFELSLIEKDLNDISYTYLTIKEWKKRYPEDEVYLLIGSDQYEKFEEWKEYNNIRKNATLVVYPRKLKEFKKNNNKDIILDAKMHDVSSSQLILKMEEDKINCDVLNYINDNGVYALKRFQLYGISAYRIVHSMEVASIAAKIAERHSPELAKKAFVAGLYHDFCKEADLDLLKEFAETKLDMTNYVSKEVLHGPVGAYIVQKTFCVRDNEVVDAIREHTLLSNPNNLLNKIVFCADKLALRQEGNLKYRKTIMATALANIDQAYQEIKTQLDQLYKGI